MTRRVAILVAAGVGAVAVAAAAWAVRSSSVPSVSPPGSHASAPPATGAASPPARPGPAVELALQIDGGTTASIPVGAAVILRVSVVVSAGSALPADAAEPAWTSVSFRLSDSKQPLLWRLAPLPPTVSAEDEEGRVFQVAFAVEPGAAAAVSAGVYDIEAVLPVRRPDGTPEDVMSNSVRIAVESSAADSDSRRRLEQAARYYVDARRWQDAHNVAIQLVQQSPDASAYLILGDALHGLGRDEEALAAYFAALAELGDADESPDYVLARIGELNDRRTTKP